KRYAHNRHDPYVQIYDPLPTAHPHSPPLFFSLTIRPPPTTTLFPYTTLFRSRATRRTAAVGSGFDHAESRRPAPGHTGRRRDSRSEEHTSELQSPYDLVCRLLLEKKKKNRRDRAPLTSTTPSPHRYYFSHRKA